MLVDFVEITPNSGLVSLSFGVDGVTYTFEMTKLEAHKVGIALASAHYQEDGNQIRIPGPRRTWIVDDRTDGASAGGVGETQ